MALYCSALTSLWTYFHTALCIFYTGINLLLITLKFDYMYVPLHPSCSLLFFFHFPPSPPFPPPPFPPMLMPSEVAGPAYQSCRFTQQHTSLKGERRAPEIAHNSNWENRVQVVVTEDQFWYQSEAFQEFVKTSSMVQPHRWADWFIHCMFQPHWRQPQ